MSNIATALVMVLQTMLPKIGQERFETVIDDMVTVVDSELKSGNMKSSLEREEALAMLSAAFIHESGFREEVENCKIVGDGGRSIGLGQVMRGQNWRGYKKKEICSDRKLQIKLSLHVIDKCKLQSPKPAAVFRCYTSGDASKDSHTAQKEYKSYRTIKSAISSPEKKKETSNDDKKKKDAQNGVT